MPLNPKKLDAKCASLLSDRLNDERTANLFYLNAKNYCENAGYLNAAKYFTAEAADELIHAEKIQHYLTDWNVMPKFKALAPPQEITGLVDIIEKAYNMELGLLDRYQEVATSVFDESDYSTFGLIQDFVKIQTHSVAEYSTLLNQLQLIDSADKNWLQEFEETHFSD